MCCFLAAFLGGGFIARAWRSHRLPHPGAVALPAGLVVAGAFAAWHLPHFAARAEANERALLAEILAEPICRPAPTAAAAAPLLPN